MGGVKREAVFGDLGILSLQMAGGVSLSSSEFAWGERVAGLENSYERMCFKGVWYSLYDCVHIRSPAEKPFVGKIMRLYEEDGERKMRVRWFLRASELPLGVSKDFPENKNKKELFIAQGSIKGVENVNLVVTILGKVTVLCTANVPRNPPASQQHVDDAHYYFSRVYDAYNRKLIKMERVDRALASRLFNKPEWVSPPVVENSTWEDLKSPTSVTDFAMVGRKRLSPNAQEMRDTTIKKSKGGS